MSTSALAVFDLDGTVTRHDTLLPFLLGYLRRRPWRLPRLLLAAPAVFKFLVTRDRGAVKGALVHAALGGATRYSLDEWADDFVPHLLRQGLHAAALDAIAEHRARGERLLLMSASTALYVPRIAHALGFDECLCTQVRWLADGTLEGHLASANVQGEEKRRLLSAILAREQPSSVSAYGNSYDDLAHMRLVQHAVLVNGSARAQAAAGENIQKVKWN